jgi:hypothetical protein
VLLTHTRHGLSVYMTGSNIKATSYLVVAAMIWLPQFSASKECRGGDFSAGFSSDFPVSRFDVVVRRLGNEVFRLPLPQPW